MNSAFSEIGNNGSLIAAEWTVRTFATGSTYRIFEKNQKSEISKFLKKRIGDGGRLAALSTENYDKEIEKLVWHFQLRFKSNKKMRHRRPNFGQAAKIINLYVKQLLLAPDYLLSYDKKKMESHAHVILDGIVLRHIAGHGKDVGHFGKELSEQKIIKRPQLRSLHRGDYFTIQNIIREAAKRAGMPPLAYDYLWALEAGRKRKK